MAVARITLNLFSMPFGLAGLASTWLVAAQEDQVPHRIAEGLLGLSAALWLIVVLCYLRYVLSTRGALRADLADGTFSPFFSLIVITPMLLSGDGVVPMYPEVGRIMLNVCIGLVVLCGALLTGQWVYVRMDLDKVHSGYFLPTVAGALIASACAAEIGERRLAEALFGIGVISWIIFGSLIIGRLFFRPPVPIELTPTMAIEVAPAAVASLAYFALDGDRLDMFAAILAGYGSLMVLAQLRLLPRYARLSFTPSTWAFAFAWSAVASTALHWINASDQHDYRLYADGVLAAITTLIMAIFLRTVIAVLRRQLLPREAIEIVEPAAAAVEVPPAESTAEPPVAVEPVAAEQTPVPPAEPAQTQPDPAEPDQPTEPDHSAEPEAAVDDSAPIDTSTPITNGAAPVEVERLEREALAQVDGAAVRLTAQEQPSRSSGRRSR
ncbi:MAG TPA: hypothetical protein VHW44_13055 [Pseudonocardiaceae bacterium]|nr:hypothetical protein [Pseudonocardiaceae bacterium]